MKRTDNPNRPRRILVVDDENLVCWSLKETFSEAGFSVETASNGKEARDVFDRFNPNIVLLDIRLPDADGIDLLSKFKKLDSDIIVLMITAYADADSAVNALKAGADDYIGKPFDLDKIKHTVEQCFQKKRLCQEVALFRREQQKKYNYDNLIGNSPQIIEVFKLIKVCAETDSKIVLILGESGTGKQLVARAIHYHSARSNEPFIETNCAAIPEHLLENELFGHERGAFTDAKQMHKGIFEAADGGTVFLDEIGDMTTVMQTKILKIIESNRFRRLGGKRDVDVDVRIIAATNQDIRLLVKQKKFRGDLFYRLNVMTIDIPPLKKRKNDIPALVNYFITRLNQEYGKSITNIDPSVLECLNDYDWPGNVRELRNCVERAMMLEKDNILTTKYFNREITECRQRLQQQDQFKASEKQKHQNHNTCFILPASGISLEEVEKDLIRQALTRFNGNQTKTAKCLQISRDTLRYRIKKYSLQKFLSPHYRIKSNSVF